MSNKILKFRPYGTKTPCKHCRHYSTLPISLKTGIPYQVIDVCTQHENDPRVLDTVTGGGETAARCWSFSMKPALWR